MAQPDLYTQAKALVAPLRTAMYDFEELTVRRCLDAAFQADAAVHLCHPFGSLVGPEANYQTAYRNLFSAIPDLERRDTIVIAGPDGIEAVYHLPFHSVVCVPGDRPQLMWCSPRACGTSGDCSGLKPRRPW